MRTIPFTPSPVDAESPATLADLQVHPGRCRGAVIFHRTGRVLCYAAGEAGRTARGRDEERAMAALVLTAGSPN